MEYKKLNQIANLLNGYAFKSANYVKSGIRIVRIANVQDGYISDEQPCFYPKETNDIGQYMLQDGDLLISLTGNVGRVALLPSSMLPAALNQRVSCIRLMNSSVSLKYLFFYFRRKIFIKDCIEASKGVAQLNLSTKWLENYMIPVPSIQEQERIVSRIEELFSQLDDAVETLKKTKAQLAVYRQAVLKEAFEKEITKYPYKEYSLKELVTGKDGLRRGPFGGSIKKSCFVPAGYKVYEQGNAINDTVKYGKYFISEEKYHEMSGFQIAPHDLLVSCSGTLGRITELPDDAPEGIINQALLRIRLNREVVCSKYFICYFRSELFQQKIIAKSQGSAMANLVSIKEFKEISLSVPDLEYQPKLLQFIDEKMSVCDSIEQTVDAALQQAEAMRQSILKSAFEGRL